MTKLADVTFESAQSGVTFTATGTGCTAATETGTVEFDTLADSTKRARINYQAGTGTTAYCTLDLATLASVGNARAVGGQVREAGYSNPPSATIQLITARANSGGTFVAQIAVNTSGNLILRYNNNGTILEKACSSNGLLTNTDHRFHFFVDVSTPSSSRALLLVNGASVVDQTFSTATGVTLGTGLSEFRLGQYTTNTVASTSLTVWDGVVIGNAATEETSVEVGSTSTITGNASPVADDTRTLALSTDAGSPNWASDDPDVMTVNASTGLVTLEQAAGGVANISDGGGDSVLVEFAPRSSVFTAGNATDLGATFTVPVTLASVSDGHTTYPDIFPAVGAIANCTLSGIAGANPNWVATFAKAGSDPFQIIVNGVQITLPSDLAAAGTVTTAGSAQTSATVGLAGAGVVLAGGSAADRVDVSMAALGITTSGGAADQTATISIAATGLAQSAGAAGVSPLVLLAAAGAALAGGNADLAAQLDALAQGSAASGGSAALEGGAQGDLAASGGGLSAGGALLQIIIDLAAIGAATSGGSAGLEGGAQGDIAASGGAVSGAAATASFVVSLTASGFVQAMGGGGLSVQISLAAVDVALSGGQAQLSAGLVLPDMPQPRNVRAARVLPIPHDSRVLRI